MQHFSLTVANAGKSRNVILVSEFKLDWDFTSKDFVLIAGKSGAVQGSHKNP